MKSLFFPQLAPELDSGVALLADKLAFATTSTGIQVDTHANPQANELKVQYDGHKQAVITYPTVAAFFRGLTRLCTAIDHNDKLNLTEQLQFSEAGLMLDVSRNAALTVAGVKEMLRLSAQLGLNRMLLYMEDVYELPQYPYWGYLRGRYSGQDLEDIDAYGQKLGVAVIPCIQTLAHLQNPMKWPWLNQLRDINDILLVDDERTYTFLRNLLTEISRHFHTDKIHIGMDEAFNLGRGQYLTKHGYVDPQTLMQHHVKRVFAILKDLHLKPMMWSDMWFNGDYTNEVEQSQDLKTDLANVNLMYWDYYNHQESLYDEHFKKHHQLSDNISFATGIWTWNGFAPNYGKTFATMDAGMAAAKANQIPTVYATMWGDDGAETPILAARVGIQHFAEHIYHAKPSIADTKQACHDLQKLDADRYLLLDQFDQLQELTANNPDSTRPSKLLLYEDLLTPLYAINLQRFDLIAKYQQLATDLQEIINTQNLNQQEVKLFHYYELLAQALQQKASLLKTIPKAYREQNQPAMQENIAEIKAFSTTLTKLRAAHRDCWFILSQPFGWEVMDVRYGGLISRNDTAIWRLTQWLQDPATTLPELEQKLLPVGKPNQASVGNSLYTDIVTVSKLGGV